MKRVNYKRGHHFITLNDTSPKKNFETNSFVLDRQRFSKPIRILQKNNRILTVSDLERNKNSKEIFTSKMFSFKNLSKLSSYKAFFITMHDLRVAKLNQPDFEMHKL